MKDTVSILGTRGSVPVHLPVFLQHGGATTSVFVRLAGQPIVLDAGTGLLDLDKVLLPGETDLPLLISHFHVDHILGLPLCPLVFDPQRRFRIYAATHGSVTAQEKLRSLMSPPLWPVRPEELPAQIDFHDIASGFSLGEVRVDTMEGIHPGGVTLFRLRAGGKCIVFITDCTLTEQFFPKAVDFARDCDLLLCDGQYSEEEWPSRRTFGHSTWTAAAQLGAACGAKTVRIMHHDPTRTDDALNSAVPGLQRIHQNCGFARAGEEIPL